MVQKDPLEKEEFQNAQDSAEPVNPLEHDHSMRHRDGLVEPKVKEYVPLEVGIVVFTIIVLGVIFVGLFSDMWGLM